MSLNARSKDIGEILRSKHDQNDLDVAITDILVTSLETDSLDAVYGALAIWPSTSVVGILYTGIMTAAWY